MSDFGGSAQDVQSPHASCATDADALMPGTRLGTGRSVADGNLLVLGAELTVLAWDNGISMKRSTEAYDRTQAFELGIRLC